MTIWQHQKDGADFVSDKPGALLWWGMGCLSGDTILKVKRNGVELSIFIEDLYVHFNGKDKYEIKTFIDNIIQWSGIDNVSYSGKKELIKIVLKSDNFIKCTLGHRIMTTSGQWVEAGHLLINDSIYTTYCEDKVKAIHKISSGPTYDITMKHSNNFVANGIVVHNSGKTYATINIIKEESSKLVLVACPKSVVNTWKKEIEKYAKNDFIVIAPTKGSVAKKAEQIKNIIEYNKTSKGYFKENSKPIIVILNYEAVWRPGLGQIKNKYKNIIDNGLLKNLHWDIIIADECFSEDTMISTPNGQIKIQNIKIGDIVYGYDHTHKKVIKTKVCDTMKNVVNINKVVNFQNTKATDTHPIFTKDGYKPITKLEDNDILLLIGDKNHGTEITLQALQNRINKKTRNKLAFWGKKKRIQAWSLLFKTLLCNLFSKRSSNNIKKVYTRNKIKTINQYEKTMEQEKFNSQSSCSGKSKFSRESFYKKQNRIIQKSSLNIKKARLQSINWWKWNWIIKTTKNIVQIINKNFWELLENGSINIQQFATVQSRASLCNRHSKYRNENSNRNRWSNSFSKKNYNKRQNQRSVFDRQRMDGNEISEQKSSIKFEQYITVYNFETGTNNYFANGILVHNCQRLRTAGSKVSKFMSFLKADKKIGLSGTPFSTPLSPYAVFRFLDKSIFSEILPTGKVSTSFQLYKLKYCIYGGFENRQVIEYINQEDLNEKIHSITHRIKTEDVIELPPFQHIPIEVEMKPQAMKAYRLFKKEALLEFENGKELTAANVLVKHLRLAQIASGTVKDDDGVPHLIDNSKLLALKDLITGIDEQIVIFTRFRAEVIQIEEMISKLGSEGGIPRTTCKIVGGCDERDKFENKEADIAIVNVASGGVGLNELKLANYSIYFSSGYDSLLYEQSLWRTRRSGSDITKTVFYYHIIALGTIDQIIMDAINKKIDIVDAVLEDFKSALHQN